MWFKLPEVSDLDSWIQGRESQHRITGEESCPIYDIQEAERDRKGPKEVDTGDTVPKVTATQPTLTDPEGHLANLLGASQVTKLTVKANCPSLVFSHG